MEFAGRFRAVSRRDHAVPEVHPRSITGRGCPLDIRIWTGTPGSEPLLLVSASRKQGRAVHRNRFRRRVRMALLSILQSSPHLAPLGGVVWVRPSRGVPAGCDLPYAEIESLLNQALSRWKAP